MQATTIEANPSVSIQLLLSYMHDLCASLRPVLFARSSRRGPWFESLGCVRKFEHCVQSFAVDATIACLTLLVSRSPCEHGCDAIECITYLTPQPSPGFLQPWTVHQYMHHRLNSSACASVVFGKFMPSSVCGQPGVAR